MDILQKIVTRKFIANNKTAIAITLSILIHSFLLFSIKLDKYLGTTNKPIEFTELKIITGAGESIKKNRSSQSLKTQSNTNEQQKRKKSNTENSTNVISSITTKSKVNKQKIQTNEQKENEKNKKLQNSELINYKKESKSGNKSKKLVNETSKGKLKGKGNKEIICKKCIEPIYSQQSIRKSMEGITIVKVTIDTNGEVKNAIIIRSSGHEDIDNASIQAAIKSTFRPITDKSTINIRYEHKIKNYR
tara:strand:- start:22 stop:762 length:741 start_codon:yes stop_codon:yes gene_type:complete